MKNGLVIDKYSNKRYYENDQYHRLGGLPAVEGANGYKAYWENGQRHRLGGLPAIEWVDGSKEYWENDQLHRLTGPAVKYIDGYKEWWYREWWYRGKKLDCTAQEEFEQLMKLKAFW